MLGSLLAFLYNQSLGSYDVLGASRLVVSRIVIEDLTAMSRHIYNVWINVVCSQNPASYLHEPAQSWNIAGSLPKHGRQQRLEQRGHVEGWQFPRMQLYQLSKYLEHIWVKLLQGKPYRFAKKPVNVYTSIPQFPTKRVQCPELVIVRSQLC